MTELMDKIKKRRTFAIISHPDAGKTTLTEKLLLYGGAIHLAGSVKARKSNKHAVSDWMEIEKQRGISVTSSVLQFDYDGFRVNILDTPGHQDFSEDTYRTLMAADSAVMLIDAAKGVEPQTKKLFWVCHRRRLPIFTFINKLDRYGRNPFDLMDELEKVLNIRAYPINWPIGIDGHYKGVYNRLENTIELFEDDTSHGANKLKSTTGSLDDPKIREMLGDDLYENLCNDIELLDMAGDEFDMEKVNTGELTPMFFGSAMTNFGVQSFLEKFLEMSPMPQPRMLQDGTILSPENEKFSAFVFKIQANMNPAHRDRISFMRICSGVFDKGMSVYHKQSGKMVKLAQPQQFLAQERTIVEKAYPGDIIGVFDPGIFGIGDSLSDNSLKLQFEDFPVFPPEIFARVQPKDSLKRKQFEKGIIQLSQEGAIQVFRQEGVGLESYIVGVVGVLQLEVLEYRLLNEYSAKLLMNQLPYSVARWVYAEDKKLIENIKGLDNGMLVYDKKDRPVILVNNEWSLNWILERNPGIQFLTVPADVEKI
ncbi:peptide chain release factor 3 [uncultured Phascolarctobacterium sp.]|uniref:peptide chain release factor 3 n=1 Tax=uncultured Phascolarctobacterium sp. TaxID=512296 RepID=UPI0025F26A06|nr:peptide chain release factor 3 [uncultured Phascolarctobacterium sp.]